MSGRLNHIVLIHGASHGGYCWDLLTPLLRERGYGVSAPDLPGLGEDMTPASMIRLQSYIDRAVETVAAAGERVLLVGHSMGGTVCCGAGEAIAERIGRIVFVAGGLHADGEAVSDLQTLIRDCADPSAIDAMQPSTVEGAIEFETKPNGEPFYNTCSPEIARMAMARLRPQPAIVFTEPLHLTAGRFGAIPKTYIVCTQDRAFSVGVQHILCERMPGVRKREMNTDHSPFYADPEALAAILDEEARL